MEVIVYGSPLEKLPFATCIPPIARSSHHGIQLNLFFSQSLEPLPGLEEAYTFITAGFSVPVIYHAK
jgi:hypothetical protein